MDAQPDADTIPFAFPTATKRLPAGSQLGAFRVEALLGAGGMGEVYRAYDTRLGRAVALKVLPDSFANDADRRGRFEEEARALAALNHRHIGAIYGVEESADISALVLELVDGLTLREHLAAGPMPFDDVVRIARQLTEGLEAAHERGIIHRDLKPANIKITFDGNAKILDFGLAKIGGWAAQDVALQSASTAQSPRRRATIAGAIVGTPAYMSPEQACGKAVDKRADIWAFGCVLFEMCGNGPPFSGGTVKEVRSAVIEREPDWQRLRRNIPPALERILRRCLIKDPKHRLRDIGEARIALAPDHIQEPLAPPASRRPAITVIAGMLALASLLSIGWLYGARPSAGAPSTPIAVEVFPPENGVFRFHPGRPVVALSPDGQRWAFLAAPTSDAATNQIWIRDKSTVPARLLSATKGAAAFFWSPDGRSLAFVANGKLNRIDLPDGPVVPIADVNNWGFTHGTWGAGGVILLGLGNGTAIEAVSVADGAKRVVLSADAKNGEARVHWPWFLPDGNRFLFTARLVNGEGELRIGQLDGRWRPVMRMTSNAQWVAPDHVVFVRDGALMARRIDLDAARPIGDPFSIVDDPVDYFWTTGRGMFSAALTGDVAYHRGGDLQQLVWADETGTQLGTVGSAGNYASVRLSEDDTSLLMVRLRPGIGTGDIWRYDLVSGKEVQLTDGIGSELTPMFAADRRGIYFGGDTRGGVPRLFYKDLTTGEERQLLPHGSTQQYPTEVFADGSLVYMEVGEERGRFQLFKLPTRPPGPAIPFLHGVQSGSGLRLSSTGRAVSFVATDTDRLLYVAMADGTSPPMPVAKAVAGPARWSRDGKRIYFIGADNMMMSATVRTASRLEVDTPRPLFKVQRQTILVDVANDGRLLLLEPRVVAAERPLIVKLHALPSTRR